MKLHDGTKDEEYNKTSQIFYPDSIQSPITEYKYHIFLIKHPIN